MTDNKTNEKLLEAFFADCRMDLPDDGFSDRVMAALPEDEVTANAIVHSPVVAPHHRLERLWTAACVAIGIVALLFCQGWEQLQSLLFTMKIDFLLSGSRLLTQVTEAISQSHNLLMLLAGMLTVVCVWGYNELLDARAR